MQPTPDAPDAGQRAALRRLRRAQLVEARRIRQAVADGYALTPAQLRSPRPGPARQGPSGRHVAHAHTPDVARPSA